MKERIENEAPGNHFMLNEIVLATVPGYVARPAKIFDINGLYTLNFLEPERGKNSGYLNFHSYYIFFQFFVRNPLRCNAIARFELNSTIPLMKRKGYRKAMREVELVLGIPKDISMFNR